MESLGPLILLISLKVFYVLSGLFPIRYQMGRLLKISELLERVKARPHEEIRIDSREDFSIQGSTASLVLPSHPAVRVPHFE